MPIHVCVFQYKYFMNLAHVDIVNGRRKWEDQKEVHGNQGGYERGKEKLRKRNQYVKNAYDKIVVLW